MKAEPPMTPQLPGPEAAPSSGLIVDGSPGGGAVEWGLSEEHKVQTPAFTDTVRLYRQAQGHFGTWEMMCGVPSQILSNLVMDSLLPELRELISPRLKGKLYERQRNWMLISDAVYSLVQNQCQTQYEAVVQKCEASRSSLEASIRTDMDQIITSKEHVTNKVKAVVLPKAEKLLKVSIEPYISSILDALMEPTSRGFFEVRDVFFRELVDMSKNTLNNGTKEMIAQHMEKISMLAFHPVKMQSCYEKVEQLSLEGLQQRFDVSSPSVFVQRAQILMRKQMDDAVYTFEQILNQSLESQSPEDLCKTIQRCQDRVMKVWHTHAASGCNSGEKKNYFNQKMNSSFIEQDALNRLSLSFPAVKEAAVQRRHNLYRDSIVLSNSDPSLHLLGENPSIDWAEKYGEQQEEGEPLMEVSEADGECAESQKRRRVKQVVSMIQVEGSSELFKEAPAIDVILEEADGAGEEKAEDEATSEQFPVPKESESPPDTSGGSSSQKDEPNPEELPEEKELTKVESPVDEGSSTVEGENLQPVTEEKPSQSQESEEILPSPPRPVEICPKGTETTSQTVTSISVLEEGKAEDLCEEKAALTNPEEDGGSVIKEELKEDSKAVVEEEPLCKQTESEEALPEAKQTTPQNPPEISKDSELKEGEETTDEPCDQDIPVKAEAAAESAPVSIQVEEGENSQPASEEPQPNDQEASNKQAPTQTQESNPENPVLPHNDSGFQSPTSEVVEQVEVTSTADPQA
ncbi:PREDICTED: niban-like protein 1 [Cyprinodon variegatus]|uniref:niban-like protein 1 n=1 Tax=Cyprinodon variegatus TaxID=28743 RepID=UPI0007425181|nr:PREDICTED: niban-like protein 1 [Cyprinodon variegatus]